LATCWDQRRAGDSDDLGNCNGEAGGSLGDTPDDTPAVLGWTARELFGLHPVPERQAPTFRRLSRGISNLDKLAREVKVDEAFLSGLKEIIRQGRDAVAGHTSREYGSSLIAELPAVKKEGMRKKELIDAMNRLLAENKIHIGPSDDVPSKAKKCLFPGAKP
jgi:hypothetical protein